MKRLWMPLYVGDFLADTQHLSATETGIYIRLIMHCWMHETIPRDRGELSRIAHCDSRLWHQYEEKILRFFDVVDASTMQHGRVTSEILRCEKISSKRKEAAIHMHSKRTANAMHMHRQSQSYKKDSAGAVEPNGKALAPASQQMSAKEWDQILTSYKQFGTWSRYAGPEPSSPACRCPQEILDRYGLTKALRMLPQ